MTENPMDRDHRSASSGDSFPSLAVECRCGSNKTLYEKFAWSGTPVGLYGCSGNTMDAYEFIVGCQRNKERTPNVMRNVMMNTVSGRSIRRTRCIQSEKGLGRDNDILCTGSTGAASSVIDVRRLSNSIFIELTCSSSGVAGVTFAIS